MILFKTSGLCPQNVVTNFLVTHDRWSKSRSRQKHITNLIREKLWFIFKVWHLSFEPRAKRRIKLYFLCKSNQISWLPKKTTSIFFHKQRKLITWNDKINFVKLWFSFIYILIFLGMCLEARNHKEFQILYNFFPFMELVLWLKIL